MKPIKYEELQRLASCMQRAENGEELTVGFLGGSITQGSLASDAHLTYAYQVYEWWRRSFPKALFHYVNGGIGGTTSHFGVARAVRDVLMYQPDLVVVDFSVNDEANDFFAETFEGLLRRLLAWPSRPAALVLNNVYYDTGVNAQRFHNAVADHYGVPHVSIRDTIYPQIGQGLYTRDELTADGLHPNDKGHRLVAGEIIRLLERVRHMAMPEAHSPAGLPAPITQNVYEHARCLTIVNALPDLAGFRADTEEKKGHLDCFRNGWIGRRIGDRIRFRIRCSCIAVQYRKTIQKPSPVARAVLDGDVQNAVVLDGNFEEDWGDCLFLQTILHHGVKTEHTVEIEIIEAGETDATPFYLLAVLVAGES